MDPPVEIEETKLDVSPLPAPFLACLVAIMCQDLEGFRIASPSHLPPRPTPTLLHDHVDKSYKTDISLIKLPPDLGEVEVFIAARPIVWNIFSG